VEDLLRAMNSVVRKLAKILLSSQPSRIIRDEDLEYFLWLCSLYLRIRNIPGHIAEIGVADGRNAIIFGRLIKMSNDQSVRQYVGFDTFDGFTERDLERDHHLSGRAWKGNSLRKVLERCERNDVEELVELFQGDAEITVPIVLANHRGKKFQKGKPKFALVYIDCNAFTPALSSMRSFLPYMMPGGLFVIDEKQQGGETEAIVEFAKAHGLSVRRNGGNEVPMEILVSD
jgi:hypothetical protein